MLNLWRVFPLWLTVFVVLVMMLGCNAGPTFRADATGTRIQNTAASQTNWTDGDGTLTSSFQGSPPAVIAGAAATISAPGPHRVLSISQGTDGAVSLTLADPADTNFKGLSVTLPDGTQVALAEFQSSASAVIAAYDRQVIAALEAQGRITAENARVAIAALDAGRTLVEALAEIGLQAVLPVPKKRAPQEETPPVVIAPPPADYGPTMIGLGGTGGLVALALLFARQMNQQNHDLRKTELELHRSLAEMQRDAIAETRLLVRDIHTARTG